MAGQVGLPTAVCLVSGHPPSGAGRLALHLPLPGTGQLGQRHLPGLPGRPLPRPPVSPPVSREGGSPHPPLQAPSWCGVGFKLLCRHKGASPGPLSVDKAMHTGAWTHLNTICVGAGQSCLVGPDPTPLKLGRPGPLGEPRAPVPLTHWAPWAGLQPDGPISLHVGGGALRQGSGGAVGLPGPDLCPHRPKSCSLRE